MGNIMKTFRVILLGVILNISLNSGVLFAKPPAVIALKPVIEKAAIIYNDPVSSTSTYQNLIYNLVNDNGTTNKLIFFSYPSSNYPNYRIPFDAANFRNTNGQVDNYVLYPDIGSSALKLMTIPNHNFNLRTVQNVPFAYSSSVSTIIGLSLEIGADSSGQPMPVIAIHYNTFTGIGSPHLSTIELLYKLNGTWHSLYNNGTVQFSNITYGNSLAGTLGLSLDTQTNGATGGANLVFYINPLSATGRGLYSVDYNFIGTTPTVSTPVLISGSTINSIFEFPISKSALIGKNLSPSPFGAFYCSYRVGGQQWNTVSSCLPNASNVGAVRGILGTGGSLFFVPLAISNTPTQPNSKSLYLYLIDVTAPSNPIFSILVNSGSSNYIWTSITKDYGNAMYILASKMQLQNFYLDLYGVTGNTYQFIATVDNVQTENAKILPLD